MPSREAQYRNLVLNQRVEASNPFVSRSIWQLCGTEPATDFEGLSVYAGLDLAEVNDLAALVLVVPDGGIWHVKPTFWLPAHGLRDKSAADRVPYDLWNAQGFLETTPGRTVEYEFIAHHLRAVCDAIDVRKIAFDRWGFRHLRPWLLEAGFEERDLEGDDAIFEEFGQGFQSMSPALRDLEAAILNERLAHGNHPVLSMCAANAVVQSDPAGNRKLTKTKSHGRIDGMVALAMATSVAVRYERDGPSVYEERGALVL